MTISTIKPNGYNRSSKVPKLLLRVNISVVRITLLFTSLVGTLITVVPTQAQEQDFLLVQTNTSQPTPASQPTSNSQPSDFEKKESQLEKETLEIEKLQQEIEKLQIENEYNRNPLLKGLQFVSVFLPIYVAIFGGGWTLYQYIQEIHEKNEQEKQQQQLREKQKDDREKQERKLKDKEKKQKEEERFERIIKNLGSNREQERIGAAISLPTFLNPDYERFYIQVFNLVVGNLRLYFPEYKDTKDQSTHIPLIQSLAIVFRKAYPLVRESLSKNPDFEPQQDLNASNINLDKAYFVGTDLKQAWLREASMKGAILRGVSFQNANLQDSNMSQAKLRAATLREANLEGANFMEAELEYAVLSKADATEADFTKAKMKRIIMQEAVLKEAKFINADLESANLSGADATQADFSNTPADSSNASMKGIRMQEAVLKEAKFSDADLESANLSGANATKADFANAKMKGIIMEEGTVSGAKFEGADLTGAKFINVDFSEFKEPSGQEIKTPTYLKDAVISEVIFEGVTGLTKETFKGVKGVTLEQIEEYLKANSYGPFLPEDS